MKRSMVLVVAGLMCLSLTGIAYAAWAQNVLIDGDLATGTFDIQWVDVTLDRTDEPTFGGDYVASVHETLSEDGHTVTYVVNNAYPGWKSSIRCRVKNTGTIPAKLSTTLVKSGDLDVTHGELPATLAANTTSDEVVITVSVPEETTAEGQEYSFTLTVRGTQFNIGE